MSRSFFDTSALVPVVTEQLANHTAAHARFVRELKGEPRPCCSTHTLAECYATLTALPVPQRISGTEAARLIEANFANRLEIVDLTAADYQAAIRLCADLDRASGQIYDALHLTAAVKRECTRLFTYNLKHFSGFALPPTLQVSAP